MKRTAFTMMSLVAAISLPCALSAQASSAQVAVTAGSATDERGVRSDAVTLAPSVLFTPGANSNMTLGLSATRFANTAWQIGGGGVLNARTPQSAGFALALNADGNVAQASFNATFAQADATPTLQWTGGPLTVIGGMHVASGYSDVSASSSTPLLPPSEQLVSQSRSAFAPSYGAELRVGTGAPTSAVISFREEPTRVGGMLVTDQLAGATVSFGPTVVSALAGHRSAPDENLDFASGSLSVPIVNTLSFTMAAGKYPSNRLTGAAGGRFFSTGFAVRFGGARGPVQPEPSGVRMPLPDITRFAIRAPDAQRVELAGDWDSWALQPTTRSSNGVWYVDLPLKSGEYRYAFRVNGSEWRVPEGAVAVDDGFGGKAAYVTVRTADSALAKHNQEDK